MTGVRKLDKKTFTVVFLGYLSDHATNRYRMNSKETDSVVDTCDVPWAGWHRSHNPLKTLGKQFKRQPLVDPSENNEYNGNADSNSLDPNPKTTPKKSPQTRQ